MNGIAPPCWAAHLTLRRHRARFDAASRCGILGAARPGASISRLIPIDDLNAATPLDALQAEPMGDADFFVRSNFGIPDGNADSWTVSVTGLVETPRTFTVEELRGLGESTEVVTVECAGNGRRFMDPLPEGVAWSLGAASVGEFTGVPLRRVLEGVGPTADVVDFVFTGADRGVIESVGEMNYQFSLDADAALGDGPMLIWGMNGGTLPPGHGGPLRLLVPGHYGMTSVKWLSEIHAIGEPHDGYFRERYRFFEHPEVEDGSMVGPMWVRSLITSPADGGAADGALEVRGVAWSGHGPIASVELRIDEDVWFAAELGAQEGEHAPAPWSASISLDSGEHSIAARATDEAGNTQPESVPWNTRGYANNAVHTVTVTAR